MNLKIVDLKSQWMLPILNRYTFTKELTLLGLIQVRFCSWYVMLLFSPLEKKEESFSSLSCQENNEVTFDDIFAVFIVAEALYIQNLSTLIISPCSPFSDEVL